MDHPLTEEMKKWNYEIFLQKENQKEVMARSTPEDDTAPHERIDTELNRISGLSHVQMAYEWRYTKDCKPLWSKSSTLIEKFWERYKSLGGPTEEVSYLVEERRTEKMPLLEIPF